MTDGFKETLSQINSLMWVVLSLSIGLVLLEPASQNMNVLGFSVSLARVLVVAPLALAGILLARQIAIRNAMEIVRQAKNAKDSTELIGLRKIVLSYPLVEFMRWKFDKGAEVVLLTTFQSFVDIFPALSLITFWFVLQASGVAVGLEYKIASYILGLVVSCLGIWNYRSLRRGVYMPLVGKIKTPD